LIQLSAIPGMKPLSNKKQNFQEKVKPNKCRVQSSVSWTWKSWGLHIVKAWRFSARVRSKTNLNSSRG